LAQLLVDGFQFVPQSSSGQAQLWWSVLNTGDMSVLLKLKTLLSLI
jgi:hypothetical protein